MKSNSKKLKNLLDSANQELVNSNKEPVELEIITARDISTALTQKPYDTGLVEEDKDFNFAHDVIKEMAEKGKEAVEKMMAVAEETGHPRSFEVLGQLLKVTTEIAKELVLIRKSKAELTKFRLPGEGENNTKQPESILKDKPLNVFFGTNSELLQAIEDAKKVK